MIAMTERQKILIGCYLGAVIIVIAAALLKDKDPACVRIEAKRNLALEFCNGLADRAARDKCARLADDPDIMGQCMRVIVPAAEAGCWDYVNLEALKRDAETLCP